ncbi:MAG: hypothetical protein WBC70_02235 [Candidatus Aminicenantales bacterium]
MTSTSPNTTKLIISGQRSMNVHPPMKLSRPQSRSLRAPKKRGSAPTPLKV